MDWIAQAQSLAELWVSAEPKTLLSLNKKGTFAAKPISFAHQKHRARAAIAAESLLRWVDAFKHATVAGNQSRARDAVFEIGRHYERIIHRATAHQSTQEFARKGGDARMKADRSWQSKVGAEMKGNRVSWTEACRIVAKPSGVSYKTVMNHTKDPRKK